MQHWRRFFSDFPILWGALAFTVALISGLAVVGIDRDNHYQTQRAEIQALASTQAALISQRLDAALSASYALGASLRQNNFKVNPKEFERLATELLRYHSGISSLQYAPDGVTTHIVPMAGNEKAVGNNLMLREDRNREALIAVGTRQLTLAGPFELRQGGVGIAGRLPVFEPHASGEDHFWGFSVVLIKVDELIRSANLDSLASNGYDYTLWRIHPDTRKPQVFAKSGPESLDKPINIEFAVPNGQWHLSVTPKSGWVNDNLLNSSTELIFAFVFASLVALLVYNMQRQPAILSQKVAIRTKELDHEMSIRRAAEAKLQMAARVFESSAEAIMISDASNIIVSVNRAFSTMTGYEADEVIGKSPSILASGRHAPVFFKSMFESLMKNGHWQGEVWNRRKDGVIFPQWQGITVVRGDDSRITNYLSISADITERKVAEEQINFLSHYDALTGLPNRILLQDRLKQAMMVSNICKSKVSLLSLDLDRFKVVNDTLGHLFGDQLLIEVVTRLQSLLRNSDTISRQGGDEFLIVLQDDRELSVAPRIAQKILDRLAEAFLINKTEVRISGSIGIAVYPNDGNDFETLLKRSDMAMYAAKESGRATFRFFTEELGKNKGKQMELEAELARAVKQQEFTLHYQPQIDLQTARVVGAEALVRWKHPEKGMIPPVAFIPLAEETGLIIPLGDWVLCEACRQAKQWQDEGYPPLLISVNLSGLQFRRPGLVARVAEVLAETGLSPQHLELELTESILVQDAESVLQTVRDLKGLGIKLAIDDFGTGYSSLSYLKRFAVDKLKIDQSFVRELCSDREDAAIVDAVIQLGRSLNLNTIAEGVETIEQMQHLTRKGCLQGQGYHFSKPLPASEFANYLTSRNAEFSLSTQKNIELTNYWPMNCLDQLQGDLATVSTPT